MQFIFPEKNICTIFVGLKTPIMNFIKSNNSFANKADSA